LTRINPAETLIDHALDLDWADLPPAVREAARTFLHDTIGVGIAGAKAPYAAALREAVAGWGQGGTCRILGCPVLRLPALSAAYVNAFQIHAQEFDCVHEKAVLHPLATVVAALLAETDRSGPHTGADFLAALVAGVDVAVGLGLAVTSPLKFFRPATAGIFGSVAALARLRRLDRATALDALGYALAFASGTMQAHVEGKPTLPVQVANAARGAIAAIDMATAGLPGPQASIDGPFGYLPLFETEFDLAPVLASLGQVYRITELSWKPFPTGRAGHGAIVAIRTLMREHGLTASNLDRLTYAAPPLIARLVGRPATPAMSPAYARLCLPYLASVVLTKGTVGLDDFAPASLDDPDLRALAAKITVTVNGITDPAAFVPGRAEALFLDGHTASVDVTTQFGSPDWPLSRAEHLEKAARCLAFVGLAHRHEALAEGITEIETWGDVRQLWDILSVSPEQS
jgi:2-methylcitrate dehydratase PrpD